MATTQPVLEGNTLPYPASPDGYTEELLYRGASQEMADGTIVWDLVNTSVKREFTIKWVGLTSTDKTTVETAFEAIKISYTASNFTAPTGSTYSVTRHPSQDTLRWDSVITAGATLRFGTTIKLREV